MGRLVVVSNRVGPLSDEGKAGGLAVGLADALRTRGGIWFGWSGEESAEGTFGPLHLAEEGAVSMATLDMTPADVEEFYGGFANQTLWPILHYRLDLADFDRRYEDAYKRVNERMAARLMPMLEPGDLVWVHDYHFLLFGAELREAGFSAPSRETARSAASRPISRGSSSAGERGSWYAASTAAGSITSAAPSRRR